MVLQYQTTSLTYQGGLDTKTDQRLVEAPFLQTAENCVFLKSGSIQKRTGYTLESRSLSESITNLWSLNNQRIVAQTAQDFYSYSLSTKDYINIGSKRNLQFSHVEVARNNYNLTECDSLRNEDRNLTVFAWTSSDGKVYFSINDDQKTPIAASVVIGQGSAPRIVATRNYIWIVYLANTSAIKALRISINNVSSTSLVELVAATEMTGNAWNVNKVDGLEAIIVAYSKASTGIRLEYFNDAGDRGAGVPNNGFPTVTTVTTEEPVGILHIKSATTTDSGDTKFLVMWDSTTKVKYSVIDFNLTDMTTEADYATTSICDRIGSCWNLSTREWIILQQDKSATSANLNEIFSGVIAFDGTISTASSLYRLGQTLWSEPTLLNDRIYFWTLYESSVQPTYFMWSDTLAFDDTWLEGKYLQGLGGQLPSTNHIVSNSFNCCFQKKNRLYSEDNNTIWTNTGISGNRVDFEPNEREVISQIGSNELIASGTLVQFYDGVEFKDIGFHVFPETLSAAQSGAAGVADGTYLYVATYAWTDNNGNLHESAPSMPVSFTVTGGPRNVTLTVATDRISNKPGTIVNLYRTTNGGTLFYKVTSSSTSFAYNNSAAHTISIVDTTADTSLIDNAQLYTTGGYLENIAPIGSASVVEVYANRVFLGGDIYHPNRVYFSQVITENVGLEFNEILYFNVGKPSEGEIRAFGKLDNNLIIFKEEAIYLLSGIGPDRKGLNSDFQPQRITADVGCSTAYSIVEMPDGLMFKSDKGIYLLTRDLQVVYIGSKVEAYNDASVYQAAVIADKNAVVFTLSEGNILYYNYYHKGWATWTNYNATSLVVVDNLLYHATTEGNLYVSTEDYKDDGGSVQMKIKTGWFSAQAPISQKRIKNVSILGERISDFKMMFKVFKNYENFPSETFSFDVCANDSNYGLNPQWGVSPVYGLEAGTWGGDNTWGSSGRWGGTSNDVMQYKHNIKNQKCTSICFELADDTYGDITGPAFNLTVLVLEFAMKAGIKSHQSKTV